MTLQIGRELSELLLLGGLSSVIGALTAVFAMRGLGAYVSKKGENQATKEDIATITEAVKVVEHQFNELLEHTRTQNSLRLAVLDKRLQAHQDAFVKWRSLLPVDDSTLPARLADCEAWWERNCLYLEPEVRTAFANAYRGLSNARLFSQHSIFSAVAEHQKHFDVFPDVLLRASRLPAFAVEGSDPMLDQKSLVMDLRELA